MKIRMITALAVLMMASISADARSIIGSDIENAQAAWAEGIVAIGKAHAEGDDYRQAASDLINRLYAYGKSPVGFKPTLASDDQFRGSFDEALSYFVGGHIEEDKGFAIRPWTNVRFDNEEIIINGSQAIAMGNYYFTTAEGDEVKVEYSFGYMLDDDEALVINLHHSSLPYERD